MPPERPLKTPEAAAFLGYHVGTVRRLQREGKIPARRIGPRGSLRFDRAELEALFSGKKKAR